MRENETTNETEVLSPLQRLAEIIYASLMLMLAGFLYNHQMTNTGFFTEKFGTAEQFFLYGPIFVGIIPLVIRLWTGRRNPARPYEIITSLFLMIGSLWLVIVFPLNYAHLADTLPQGMDFILRWVTDDVAKLVLMLQVIIGPITALTATWKYLSIHQQKLELSPSHQAS